MQRTTHVSECCTDHKMRVSARVLHLRGIVTSPTKDRRLLKCYNIIAYFARKSK